MSQNAGPSSSQDPAAAPAPASASASQEAAAADHPHNFDVQKELHQKIRNDPDYDDWEYGTEPLPHESWTVRSPKQASA